MDWLDKRDRHTRLVEHMCDTLGVDLNEAQLRGAVSPELLEDAVIRCTGCDDPTACTHWLETHESAENPPFYCRNVDFLKGLQ